MSHAGSAVSQPEFDFWEFVACARCHAPFGTEDGGPPQVPFWITECGHIICNNHLNVDQSCVQCGSQGIQVAPLQRKMEAPMSDWFRPATQTIESLAFSVRFQIETLASLVRYYRKKCHQQRALLERSKLESQQHKLLRKKYEDLKLHAQQLKEYVHDSRSRGSEPSETVNSNGKRQMLDSHRGNHSNSSPRSSVAPLGPDRLTLQPQLFTPRLSRHGHNEQLRTVTSRASAPDERPGSSRFAEHFAYDALQSRAALSHAQKTTLRHSTSNSNPKPPPHQSHEDLQRLWHPANSGSHEHQHNRQGRVPAPSSHNHLPPPSTTSSQIQMPPPPLPHSTSSTRVSSSLRTPGDLRSSRDAHPLPLRPLDNSDTLQPNRFLPSNSRRVSTSQQSSTMHLQTQRFVPATPPTSNRNVTLSVSSSRRSSGTDPQGLLRRHSGGQREAFVPPGK